MVVLKLGAEAASDDVVIVLLKLMFLTIPAVDFNTSDSTHAHIHVHAPGMPIASAKPTSRLLLKVLDEELKRQDPPPFDASYFDQRAVLLAIHTFFKDHPVATKHEIPFCTAKTVLAELIKKLGGPHVIKMLEASNIPDDSFIMKLASRLRDAAAAGSSPLPPSSSSTVDPKLNAQIIDVINEIVAARDKMLPIRQLHSIKRQHPSIDITGTGGYLMGMSSAFRKFVLENLERLDNVEVVDENQQPGLGVVSNANSNSNSNSNTSTKATDQTNPNPNPSVQKEQGRVASPTNTSSTSSPRSQAIRGSFIKLTKDLSSLDLPMVDSNSNSNSDNDLAARLQRLKNNIDA